jgi:demethylmenaquinone methyltransferase/2-methoxy-6-polyprenyl-1,4-benzoquinol methylase
MMWSQSAYNWFYDHVACHYYNLAMKYCFLPFGGERKVRNKLIASISFEPEEKILDMCCGTGGATFVIAVKAASSCEITGVDTSSGQLRIASKNNIFNNVKFMKRDAATTDFEDNSFDKVFITHALHEMDHSNRMAVLEEARRVLRDNGLLAVLEVDNPDRILIRLLTGLWLFYWLPFNFETRTRRDMIKSGLANEVMGAGFADVRKISGYNGIFQTVLGKKQRLDIK